GTGGGPLMLAILDLNDDGFLDVITSNNGNMSRLFGDGTGAFTKEPPGYVIDPDHPAYNRDLNPFGGSNGPHSLSLGEFLGDGVTHLATANAAGNTVTRIIRAPEQTPNGGLTGRNTNTGGGTRPVGIAVADFNGDNLLDVATANFDGNSISYLLGDGSDR